MFAFFVVFFSLHALLEFAALHSLPHDENEGNKDREKGGSRVVAFWTGRRSQDEATARLV